MEGGGPKLLNTFMLPRSWPVSTAYTVSATRANDPVPPEDPLNDSPVSHRRMPRS